MGNCFKNKDNEKQARYVISSNSPEEICAIEDEEMGQYDKPLSPKPVTEDPVVLATWKLECMG